MASIYDLKTKFQSLLRPLVRWLAEHGVTANQVTIAALVLSVITGMLIFIMLVIYYIVHVFITVRRTLQNLANRLLCNLQGARCII